MTTTVDHGLVEFTEALLEDIDLTKVPEWDRRWIKRTLKDIAQALWVFEWPEFEMGGDPFGLAQRDDGSVWLTYRVWQPDNTLPIGERTRAESLQFSTPLTSDPAEEQILNAIVAQYRHEVREQITFDGKLALYPDNEHPPRDAEGRPILQGNEKAEA